jgi:GNAT superfamily N-acetyltransferase
MMQTQLLSTLTIRPFTADDYADITRLHNLNFAEFSMTAEEFQFEDSGRIEPCRLARWVAECDGRIVGFAHYEQNPQVYHPRKFQFNITVDPGLYGRGIGRQLYDLVLREVQQFDPIAVDEWTRVDMACRVGFLERRGFVEDMRMWISALDLTQFDPSQFAHQVAAVEAQGFQLRSWADLGYDDPSVRRQIYETWLAVRDDVPIPPNDKRTETSFEKWWERVERPDFLPAGYFVAVAGAQYVGTSNLWHSPEAGELRTGTTGVRREYRRRGIALALKVRSLEFAKAQGYRRVVTENETKNHGMIGINDRLGFVKQPAYAHYLKTFEA